MSWDRPGLTCTDRVEARGCGAEVETSATIDGVRVVAADVSVGACDDVVVITEHRAPSTEHRAP